MIEEILKKIDDLPTLPKITTKIIEILKNPDSSILEVSKVISSDQVLTAKILKIINSPFYGLSRKVKTVSYAISLLGLEEIKKLVLTTSVISTLSKKGKFAKIFPFWIHSIDCAIALKVLGKHFKYKTKGELFVFGLLHDIGKIIFGVFFLIKYSIILKKVERENLPFYKVEEEIFGLNHAEVVKFLLKRWNFPEDMIEAIGSHHNLEKSSKCLEFSALVHLGDWISNKIVGKNLPLNEIIYKVSKERRPDFNETDIEYLCEDIRKEIENSKDLLFILE